MLKNYMEDVVLSVYEEFIQHHDEVCHCDQCRMDTIALALTRLRGMYAATTEGEILTRISRDDRQIRADALVAIMDAVRAVANRPQHQVTSEE